MFAAPRSFSRGWALAACVPALLALALVACGSSSHSEHSAMPGMDHGAMMSSGAAPSNVPTMSGMSNMPNMPGMSSMLAAGQGLAAELEDYRLDSPATSLPAGQAASYPFTITGPDGRPVTDFATVQTRKLHFYAIRSDLTGYQHIHPTMAADGTWTAELAALAPGNWRMYTSFTPNSGPLKGNEFVLSRTVIVPGQAATVPLPAPTDSTTVDGYTVTFQSQPLAGMAHQLTATITKDGKPVTDLQPYLDSYAHLSAFHEGDQALAHLHPMNTVDGDHGGPTLTFQAMLATTGQWRVFLQFQTAGQLHTAQLTLHIA